MLQFVYMFLNKVSINGADYPVTQKNTPNTSNTDMEKVGIVLHVTTSNSYNGAISWLTSEKSQSSATFIVGREIGQVCQLGPLDRKFWHAGRVHEPSDLFKSVAKKTPAGGYLNPNLYWDGIEFCGGVDGDGSGKVEKDEVELTDWQYRCGIELIKQHAGYWNYELTAERIITHQDIASYKPDLVNVRDEILYQLFYKETEPSKPEKPVCKKLSDYTNVEVYKESLKRLGLIS